MTSPAPARPHVRVQVSSSTDEEGRPDAAYLSEISYDTLAQWPPPHVTVTFTGPPAVIFDGTACYSPETFLAAHERAPFSSAAIDEAHGLIRRYFQQAPAYDATNDATSWYSLQHLRAICDTRRATTLRW